MTDVSQTSSGFDLPDPGRQSERHACGALSVLIGGHLVPLRRHCQDWKLLSSRGQG